LKPCFRRRSSLLHRSDGGRIASHNADHDHRSDQRQNKVEDRACRNDRDSCPHGFAVKTSLCIIFLVLSHHTGTAERDCLERISRLSFYSRQKPRPHTDGKFIYTDSICLCQQKMSQLMYDNHETENQYCDQNPHFLTTCFLSIHKSPVPSAALPP